MNSYLVTLYPYATPRDALWRINVFAHDRAEACRLAYAQTRLTQDHGKKMWADCAGWRELVQAEIDLEMGI